MRYYLFWMKVQRTETLNGNVECRISLPALLTGNNPVRRSDGESGRKKKVHVRLIPEGLHVYSNGKRMPHATPAGVVQKSASWHFYKHLMPLASGTREKTEDACLPAGREAPIPIAIGTIGGSRKREEFSVAVDSGQFSVTVNRKKWTVKSEQLK